MAVRGVADKDVGVVCGEDTAATGDFDFPAPESAPQRTPSLASASRITRVSSESAESCQTGRAVSQGASSSARLEMLLEPGS